MPCRFTILLNGSSFASNPLTIRLFWRQFLRSSKIKDVASLASEISGLKRMNRALLFLSSLKLTVALLALSLLLILFGTLDQVNIGIRGAQEKYFESVLAFWRYPPQWSGGRFLSWLHFPVAGGFLLGPFPDSKPDCGPLSAFSPPLEPGGNSGYPRRYSTHTDWPAAGTSPPGR